MSSSDREMRNNSGFFGMDRSGRSNRIGDNPSIRGAREKVAEAENAEKEADRTLHEARERVRLSRHHVQGLEQETLEGWFFLVL
jgi:hypothetical protein